MESSSRGARLSPLGAAGASLGSKGGILPLSLEKTVRLRHHFCLWKAPCGLA
ncbi:hypothetical protein [Pelagibius sp. Alg239-R121]|uniref:hypothetical protein n=1 Tax=Pelagibius sp. Alg239-R121 TaxID=2993448 RepID=UPI0024A6D138|nr:hypothetical protein [Pelagibius sp. Alg239-R121]